MSNSTVAGWTLDKFYDHVNRERLRSKPPKADCWRWVFVSEVVEGLPVSYKAFGQYIQIFKIDGVDHGGVSWSGKGLVREWKKEILDAFEYHNIN